MGPADLLREAQHLHYSKRFDEAVELYLRLVKEFPNSKQAISARQQIENLRPAPTKSAHASQTPAASPATVGTAARPASISFCCPACETGVRVGLPLKGSSFRCGACKQVLNASLSCDDPLIFVIAARVVVSDQEELEELRPYFEILCIEPTRDMEVIRKAWRTQLTQYHPDKVSALGPDLQRLAEMKTRLINTALESLKTFLREP